MQYTFKGFKLTNYGYTPRPLLYITVSKLQIAKYTWAKSQTVASVRITRVSRLYSSYI